MNENRTWAWWATAVAIVFGFAAALVINWPGHLSYDSILQLLQGRTAHYNTWHPPIMAWLLGLGDAIVPGAGLFVVLDAALAFGALFLILLLRPAQVGWPTAAVALIIVLSPQLSLYQGLVWKDVLFADACVAGFVSLAQAASRWTQLRPRLVWIAISVLLLSLAALARQNGLVILPFAAVALGWVAIRGELAPLRAVLLGCGFLAICLVVVFASNAVLGLRSDGESGPAEQFHLLEVYDLAGAVAREPHLPLATLSEDDPRLERAIRAEGARSYTPQRNDPVMSAPGMEAALENADTDALGLQWRALIGGHFLLYLQLRSAAFFWVFATPDIVACRPIFTGVEGPERELRLLNIAPRRDAKDFGVERYAKGFLGTPVFSHLTFAALAGGVLFLLLRRRRPADIAVAALLVAAFAFVATFFVISIACDYRYLYVLDFSALAALLYVTLDAKSALRGMP